MIFVSTDGQLKPLRQIAFALQNLCYIAIKKLY